MSLPPVFYAEDEPDDVFFMELAFREAGIAHPLAVVGDGRAAISWLQQPRPLPPALVLLDLNLPIISGFELLQWLRSQPLLQPIPVAVISSSNRPEDTKRAHLLGASDYLLKPSSGLDFLNLARHIKARWLASSASSEPTPSAG